MPSNERISPQDFLHFPKELADRYQLRAQEETTMTLGARMKFGILFCLLTVLLPASGQNYVFRVYRQSDGLKNLAINSMARDSEGFLWLATENGLYRFLGDNFERYGVEEGFKEPDIRDVVVDPRGQIWATTAENLYHLVNGRFQPAGTKPVVVTSQHRITFVDSHQALLASKGVLYRMTLDDRGNMQSFLQVFPNSELARVPELTQVHAIDVVSRGGGELWMGCGKGICQTRVQDLARVGSGAELPVRMLGKGDGLQPDYWQAVHLDHGGTLWAVSYDHIAVLVPGAQRFTPREIPGSAPQNIYGHSPLIEDRYGRVIVPSDNGVVRWERDHWRSFDKRNNLQRITSIAGLDFDAAGDLWIATRGTGLSVWLGYHEWEGWNDDQGLPSPSIWAAVPGEKHHLYVGTERGPARVDVATGKVRVWDPERPWPYSSVTALGKNPDNSLWLSTGDGTILEMSADWKDIRKTGKLPGYIMASFADKAGRTFFSSRSGLYVRPAHQQHTPPKPVPEADALVGLPGNFEGGCESPDGSSWFLGKNKLIHFANEQWRRPAISGMEKAQGQLLGIDCQADGSVWLSGDQAGVWHLTGGGNGLVARQLNLPQDFRALSVLSVHADRRGWVWLGTDQGLLVTNGRDWRHITQESGFIWNDTNQNMVIEDPDGSLWIGTSSGLGHLLHPENVFQSVPLTVTLSSITQGGNSYPTDQPLILPSSNQALVFRISSPLTRNRSELNFRLRLVGHQSQWMETIDGLAGFSRLDPGKYTFMTQACNPGLNSCSVPYKLSVVILPPWWRTNWFYGICTLAGIGLLILLERMQARRLIRNSRRLEELVSERTKELELSRAQLRIQATHDGLTGMLNRTAILRALSAEMDRARRENRMLCVVLIDIDHFKRINDTYGHLAGDEALRWFAAAMGAAIRPYDHAGRYGGEEFLLVLTEVPQDALEQRLQRLHAAMTKLQVRTHGAEFQINCSMGATTFEPESEDLPAEALLAVADQALYVAKSQGRNRVVYQSSHELNSAQDDHPQGEFGASI